MQPQTNSLHVGDNLIPTDPSTTTLDSISLGCSHIHQPTTTTLFFLATIQMKKSHGNPTTIHFVNVL